MIEKIKNFSQRLQKTYETEAHKNEDATVLAFLSVLPPGRAYDYLEAGSGLGRFPAVVRQNYPNLKIRCLDLNPDLVKAARDRGFEAVRGSLSAVPFEDDRFDLVHASHVIEHFSYPEIIKVLDELVRITKPGGYLIIRSPIMHRGFYIDIDHARPYLPETILNYYNNRQQQAVGSYVIKEVSRWYRKDLFRLDNFGKNRLLSILNQSFKFFWIHFRLPYRTNGYVSVFQKS